MDLAQKSGIEVIGVTVADGNIDVEQCSKNTNLILNLCGRSDIPIFKGIQMENMISATEFHGEGGLGGMYAEYEK